MKIKLGQLKALIHEAKKSRPSMMPTRIRAGEARR